MSLFHNEVASEAYCRSSRHAARSKIRVAIEVQQTGIDLLIFR